jgi:hypothetical protein
VEGRQGGGSRVGAGALARQRDGADRRPRRRSATSSRARWPRPGKPLITIFDPKGLRVIASLPQYKLAELKKSARARIEFPESGRWIDVQRVEILPTVDVRSHTATARLYLPETSRAWCRALCPRPFHHRQGAEADRAAGGRPASRRSDRRLCAGRQGRARLRQVRLGEAVAGGELEVLAGINSGERVSLTPLKAGIELKISGRIAEYFLRNSLTP